jgi:hypothetical protein
MVVLFLFEHLFRKMAGSAGLDRLSTGECRLLSVALVCSFLSWSQHTFLGSLLQATRMKDEGVVLRGLFLVLRLVRCSIPSDFPFRLCSVL